MSVILEHTMSRDQSTPPIEHAKFLELVAAVRPELHRFCARMTGSIADGEDIVQDTLLRAYRALTDLEAMPPLRPWLFRIAQNRAIDHMRSYERRMREPLEATTALVADDDPEDALARDEAMRAAVSLFIELPPAQRSCVILKDVLGHSVDEIADLLALTVPAVKAALHRGRTRLRELRDRPATPRTSSPTIARYATLFNARDWDGVRAMLAEDVRLDVVERVQKTGKSAVGTYFTNYERFTGWRVVPAWLDGNEVLAVFQDDGERPVYFVALTVRGDEIATIRDFRHVPYIVDDAQFDPS